MCERPRSAVATVLPRLERETTRPNATPGIVLEAMKAELSRTTDAFRAQTSRPAPYFVDRHPQGEP
jgi:hypothetical protein